MADQSQEIVNYSELRQKSLNWNLACDVQLRQKLEQISNTFKIKSEELVNKLNDLDEKSTITAAKLGTVTNKLMLLSQNQFIESRVYDEDLEETSPDVQEVENDKVQVKENPRTVIGNALSAGAQFMQTAFEIVEVSDSHNVEIMKFSIIRLFENSVKSTSY